MNTSARLTPQQANINRHTGLSPDQNEHLRLICTTLHNVLLLDVATSEVATTLLLRMTSMLGLQLVGASKIIVNIPTEATAAANLVNVRPPFRSTIKCCMKHFNKTMRALRNANPLWKAPPYYSPHFRDNHSNTIVD